MAKDAYYLKHDTNAASDPKIVAMTMRFGMVGYGRFWRLVEILREQADCRLPRAKWGLTTLAMAWGCSESDAAEYIDALVSTYQLLQSDGEHLWSDRLCRDVADMNQRREAQKARADKGWEHRKNAGSSVLDAGSSKNDAGSPETDAMRAEQIRAEKRRAEQSNDNATQPLAPLSVSLLQRRLEAEGVAPQESGAVAAAACAAGCSSEAFLAWAKAKAARADKPHVWLKRGVLEWGWCDQFALGAPAAPAPPKRDTYTPPQLHTDRTPEDDALVAELAAQARAKLRLPTPKEDPPAAEAPPPDVAPSAAELEEIPF